MILDPNNNKVMRSTGIEPVPYPWQGQILPLNYERVKGSPLFTLDP